MLPESFSEFDRTGLADHSAFRTCELDQVGLFLGIVGSKLPKSIAALDRAVPVAGFLSRRFRNARHHRI